MNQLIAIALLFAIFLLYLLFQWQRNSVNDDGHLISNVLPFRHKQFECEKQRRIRTALGNVTYNELQETVYGSFGFTLVRNCTPFPILKYTKQPICQDVFQEWLNIAAKYDPAAVPIQTIPDELRDRYLLNGASILSSWYRNDKSPSDPTVDDAWTNNSIRAYLKRHDVYLLAGYGNIAASVRTAFIRYKDRIMGKRGLVIGSIHPWVEVLALQQGATSMTTAEYRKIVPGDERLKYVHPVEMAQNWTRYIDQFDFIASFSSIEHSGLGRYGDPLDPIGDLRETQKLYCLLKPGQLLYLGFPVGQDELAFNVHRVYGSVRLPMMFAGWKMLDAFLADNPMSQNLTIADLDGSRDYTRQILFVLERL